MSEKRFGYGETDLFEWVEDNGKMISTKECVNKLNEFEEENEQLKKAEKINMEYAEQIVEENKKLRIQKNDLRIENEQLRQEIVHLKDDLQYYKTKSGKLEEELLNTRGCMYE